MQAKPGSLNQPGPPNGEQLSHAESEFLDLFVDKGLWLFFFFKDSYHLYLSLEVTNLVKVIKMLSSATNHLEILADRVTEIQYFHPFSSYNHHRHPPSIFFYVILENSSLPRSACSVARK